MTISVALFFYVLALVLLLLAGANISHPKVSVGWLGLFFWLLATLVRF